MQGLRYAAVLLATVVAFACALTSAEAAVGTVTVFPLSSGTNGGVGITTGLDGNLWFTAAFPAFTLETSIGTISTAGVQGPTYDTGRHSDAPGIALGPDGNLWFTEQLKNSIGRITPSGTVTHFATGTQPVGITTGPDGNIWFTLNEGEKIGRITPSGTTTLFPTDRFLTSDPESITAGADGNLWFTESYPTARVGRITTNGTLTEFNLPHANAQPYGIAAGPDGNVWVAERHANAIARVTPSGTITEFPMPRTGAGPYQLVTAADGNLWFTEADSSMLGRITTGGGVTEFPVPSGVAEAIAAGPDGNVWFPLIQGQSTVEDIARATVLGGHHYNVLSFDAGFVPGSRSISLGSTVQWSFYGPRAHEVADSSGLRLFDSGTHSIVSFFSHTFTAAGVYPYRDPLTPTLTGKISVPLLVTPTSITWATAGPTGSRVFDVQIKRPGASTYSAWRTGTTATSATFTPDAGSGTYTFRARMRDSVTGAATGYSAGKPVAVS